jgi:sorbitol-specific phosphotransferase system component IIBC
MTEEKSDSQLMDELHSLSTQLVTAVKSLWDSDESRQLRQEIGEGFVQLGQQVDEAIKTAQESETAQEFKTQVQETVDKARESDAAAKLEENLVSGLHQLNTELGKLVTSFSDSGAASDEPTPAAEAATGAEAEAEGEPDA